MIKSLRIIIVEDSEDDAELLLRQLKQSGYNPAYEIIDTAAAFNAALDKPGWDLVLSDYILPAFSGLEVLKILQARKLDIPCLIVSGKIDEETAVASMRAGAKDYIMKDNLQRLGPAIKRELAELAVKRECDLAEKTLREKEKLSSILLDGAPNPIVVFNPDFSIRSVNPAFESMTGFSQKSVTGLKAPFPWWPPTENAAQHVDRLKAVLLDGAQDQERLFHKKNGELFWVNILSSSVKDEKEEMEYYLSVWTDITAEKRLRQELELFNHRIIQAQEEERKRIARELHEDTVQILAILKLELESLLQSDGFMSPETMEKLGYLKDNMNHAMQDIRRYSYELRPGDLENLGLEVALEQLADDATEPNKLEVELAIKGEPKTLNSDIELVLFRIVQEALNNIRKHAQASRAVISLAYRPHKIVITVEDNGRGFNLETESHTALDRGSLGLISMRERAKLIGADLNIKSGRGQGTAVSVEVPVS